MRKTFHYLIIAALLTTLYSCSDTFEEVIMTYPDGNKMIVCQYTGDKDNKTLVGETRYYENGTVQYEKHYTGKKQQPDGIWHYNYDDGKTFATSKFDKQHPNGQDWKFYDREGNNYFNEQYDSCCVVELSEMQTPATVALYRNNEETHYQFYSNYTIRSIGMFRNKLREGHWVFYHLNHQIQTEADFIGGKEDGVYCVYRENGIPYYRGSYNNGQRTGVWEFYDEEGNLYTSREY